MTKRMKMYERGELPWTSEKKRELKREGGFHYAVTKTYLALGLKGGESLRDCGTLSRTV